MADKHTSLQDLFLNALRRTKTPITMFLVKGVKLQGIVTWFDNFSVLLRRDGQSQLIYKHAISTIMPANTVDIDAIVNAIGEAQKKQPLLQEIFLNAVRKSEDNVTMFLVNGVMLRGRSRRSTCSACCSSAMAWRSSSTSMRSPPFSPPIPLIWLMKQQVRTTIDHRF